jgi:AcrR family transcriptional regulator
LNEKRRQLYEAAVKCFAQKGYHATSIQEIADAVGLTKGSLYFYVKSKEELLLSVCRYYYDKMMRQLASISENSRLSPREKLIAQIRLQFQQLDEYRDFVIMLTNERSININDEMQEFLYLLRAQTHYMYYKQIIELYGEEVRPYALDAAAIIISMLGGYLGYAFLQEVEYELDHLARFMVDRLDDVVRGMVAGGRPPVLSAESMQTLLAKGRHRFERQADRGLEEIQHLRDIAETIEWNDGQYEDVLSSLLMLESEWAKPDRQPIVVKGMIAFLRSFKRKEMEAGLDLLEKQL